MRVAVVGQNPSRQCPNSSFVGTKSGERINQLIEAAGIDIENVRYYNVVERVYEKCEYPNLSEFKQRAESVFFFNMLAKFDLVIACGRFAEQSLLHGICYHDRDLPVVFIPHPSPLNRFWNSPENTKKVIEQLQEVASEKL